LEQVFEQLPLLRELWLSRVDDFSHRGLAFIERPVMTSALAQSYC
jgi:hypothetical protein